MLPSASAQVLDLEIAAGTGPLPPPPAAGPWEEMGARPESRACLLECLLMTPPKI